MLMYCGDDDDDDDDEDERVVMIRCTDIQE